MGLLKKISLCPGFDRCHPCAWIPCSKRAKALSNNNVKISTGFKPTRWPTDCLCLFLFIACWVGMVVILFFAVWSGNPLTLVLPTDYQDNICGYAEGKGNSNLYDLSDRPYLWFPFSFDLTSPSNSLLLDALDLGICVSHCPSLKSQSPPQPLQVNLLNVADNQDYFTSAYGGVASFVANYTICNYENDNATNPLSGLTSQQQFDKMIAKDGCYLSIFSTSQIGKRCVPTFGFDTALLPENGTTSAMGLSSTVQSFMNGVLKTGSVIKAGFWEVRVAWFPLVLTAIVVLVICFLVVFCIRFVLTPVIWGIVVSLWVTLFVTAAYCGYIAWDRYTSAKTTLSDGTTNVDETQRRVSYVFMGVASACFLGLLIYSCLVIFLIRRIAKAVSIIKIAARPLYRIPTILIIPPLSFLALVAITAYWLLIAGYIQSAQATVNVDISDFVSANSTGTYAISRGDQVIQLFQWYHLFGYFWSAAFLNALGYTTAAAVVAQWFFSSKLDEDNDYKPNKKKGLYKRSEPFTVARSFLRVAIFHSGSLLFGAMLVAIVQTIRVAYRKLQKALKLATATNPCLKCCLCCGNCILHMLFVFIKYFNKNAYIMMLIHGGSFLPSGARAMGLITKNIATVGTINFLGHFMLHLAQIVIAVVGCIISYLLIDLFEKFEVRLVMGEVVYYVVPVMFGLIMSYLIAGMFMNMYITSIDTILLCYLEDKRNDANYPYTPHPLRNAGFFQFIIPSLFLKVLRKVKKKKPKKDKKDVELEDK